MSSKFLTNAVQPIEITDVIGLQEELTELEEEIAGGGGNKTVETFTQQIGSTPAGFGEYKLYAKNDGFYERGTGAEVKLAGGSGGTSIAYSGGTPAISDGMVFSTGISRDFIQNDTGFRLDTTNNKLVVPDLETDDHFSINSTLTGIDYNEATSTTEIAGKLSISAGTGNAVSMTAGGNIEMTTTVGQLQTTSAGDTNIRAINGDAYFSSAAGDTAIQSDAAAVGITGGTGVNINATSGDINLTQALLNVKSATNALNSIIVYPEGKSIRFLSGGVQQGTIKLNATYSSYLELSGAGSLITQNVPNDDYSITNKTYVDTQIAAAVANLPVTTKVRIPKATDRNPAVGGNPLYTDDKIRLGWDNPSGNDLQIQLVTGTGAYCSTCFKSGSTSSNDIALPAVNTTYELNTFAFAGGETMFAYLSPVASASTEPTYRITIHYTENSVGTDGDLVWIIERFN